MGKLLSLGPKLSYPITISKLLKRPGEDINKQDAILEYSFKWMKMVGDPFGEEFEMEQTTYSTWDSPADGKISSWKIREGQVIKYDTMCVDVDEPCPHSVQFGGLCAMCGKNMMETSWASTTTDSERAKINMIHDHTSLTISQAEASKAEEELQRRLLKHRKLSLVVDLDQTIIHACIEPTVGEWQRDPTSPNYESVKDVKAFQLNDEPRGLASSCWYYIKMRPGLKEFLAAVSEKYELHVYTMGTRAYAVNIAKIVDPDKKLFGDRIISRDENGSMTAKSLARLFPVDTKMVVIIDDRADVWPKNRPNLIKVHPYDFFLGIGDINSSFLPKREELPKIKIHINKKKEQSEISSEVSVTQETPSHDAPIPDAAKSPDASDATGEPKTEDDGSKISALEELVKMGGGNDQALRDEQTAEQEKFLEKQLKDRPLLHMQEKLDSEEDVEDGSGEKNGETTSEIQHHKHNLLKDDDVELMYLEQHLAQVHKAFYDEYDSALHNAQGGRIAQLRPGHNKKVSIKADAADLKIVPDIGEVMPTLKGKVLKGTIVVLSGLVPLNADFMRSEIALQAQSFGAELQTKISRKITHLVTPTSRTRTQKVRQAAKYPHVKVVNQQWLLDSMSKWERQDEGRYLVDLPDRITLRSPNASARNLDDTLGSDDESGGSESEQESESMPASQEEADDDEGVMPSDIEGQSPIDDLKTFDWGSADNELAEFMDSDSENDSDTSSNASNSSKRSQRGIKRAHEDATDDDESDEGSSLSKKRHIASSRTTGLKTVKTPNSAGSESSLPTPGVTGDEDGDDAEDATVKGDDDEGDDFKDLEDDLEAELEAELASG
ncbi:CTD phosphatase fcp1 [Hyphodiscus hymeniophilus]|uniref:RNA polymerase II subunit A C-terminal domain phosphatase n=1 Tax=Hyphodiscus hymeniophilus TaxID=353542 RepID=A0A9P7AV96_9HELO|nr:CTD phosphatase fcp1 [Hyphodiscus hymeniophilus]